MRKPAKKLVLYRETLRDLEARELRKVPGGISKGTDGPTAIDCSITCVGAYPTAESQ